MGVAASRWEYALLLAAAAGVPVALVAGGSGPLVLLPLLAGPFAVPLLRAVWRFAAPQELNAVLKGTARLAFLFGLLFAIGLAAA
jgi:1,4-dihydroxy-2-naphthoate octaprenyltransferase